MCSVTSELLNLELEFFKASITNNIEALAKFDQDLRSFLTPAGEAYSSGSITEDEAKLHLTPVHNIQVLASGVAKVQLVMDALCQDFSSKLKFSVPPVESSVTNPTSCTAPSVAIPSFNAAPNDGDSSAASQSILKTWSQEHMSSLYPTKKERSKLASLASLSDNQVMLWFRNARTRSGWTKLYAHAQKDRARLDMLLDEYHSLRRLHGDEEAKRIIACDEGYQLVEKVLPWFDTSMKAIKSYPPKSIRPWVKDVLFSTMDTLKRGGSNSQGCPHSILPAFPSVWESGSESSTSSSTGPVASTSSVASSSRSSSPQPFSSRSANSSVRSTSPASTNTSLSSCHSSTHSLAPSACSNLLADETPSFPPLSAQLFDYLSPEPFSSPLCIPTNDSSSPVTSIVSGDLPAWPAEPPQPLSGLASLQRADSEIEAGQFDDALED